MCFSVLVILSLWQLQRAETKTELLARLQQVQQGGALNIKQLFTFPLTEVDGLHVDVHGRWLAPIVWLLDNQTYQGQVGYDVVVPLQLPQQQQLLLVNLGWVAAPARRELLPRLNIPQKLHIQGVLRTEFKGLLLGQNTENNLRWPMRIQQVDLTLLAPLLVQPIFPALIYQQEASPFKPHYQAVVLPPERHRAYALQWALLALAFVVIAMLASAHKRMPFVVPLIAGCESDVQHKKRENQK